MMSPGDVGKVLAKCVAFDNRQVSTETVQAWAEALDDMPLADALVLVTDHYRGSTRWLMPADLNEGWKRLRAARHSQVRVGDRPVAPQGLEGAEFLTFQRAASRAIARGATPQQAERVAYEAVGMEVPAEVAAGRFPASTLLVGKRI